MDKIEYCKSIQSDHYLELVTTYFEETMALYHIGCIASSIKGNVAKNDIIYDLTFNNEDEAIRAQSIISSMERISNYDIDLKVFSLCRSGNHLTIVFNKL